MSKFLYNEVDSKAKAVPRVFFESSRPKKWKNAKLKQLVLNYKGPEFQLSCGIIICISTKYSLGLK